MTERAILPSDIKQHLATTLQRVPKLDGWRVDKLDLIAPSGVRVLFQRIVPGELHTGALVWKILWTLSNQTDYFAGIIVLQDIEKEQLKPELMDAVLEGKTVQLVTSLWDVMKKHADCACLT